ncbi:MAG: hypothetical protein RRY25_06700, partial [Anaerovorax sp.]
TKEGAGRRRYQVKEFNMKTKNKSKKKKRIIILMAVLLVGIILAAFLFFYLSANSHEKKEYAAEISKQSQAFTEKLLAQMDQIAGLTGGSGSKNHKQESEKSKMSADGASNEPVPSALTAAEQKIIDEEKAKLKDQRKQELLQTMSQNYTGVMNQQKNQAFAMLDSLLAQGRSEWMSLKAQGKATPTAKSALASEYLGKVAALESTIDGSFAAIIGKMETQLRAEGIDPAPIVAQYQAEYESIKSSNRSAMFNKAMNAMQGN